MPPSAADELHRELGDKIVVETSDWNVGSSFTPNHGKNRSTTPACAVR